MKKNKYLLLFTLFILASCSQFSKPLKDAQGFTNTLNKNQLLEYDKIYEGIYINNIDVKDLSKEDVLKKIKDSFKNPDIVNLKYNDKIFKINLNEIDYKLNIEKIVDDCYTIGRNGTSEERISVIKDLIKNPKYLTINSEYSQSKLKTLIDDIQINVETEIVDDSIGFEDNKAYIISGQDKIILNHDEIYNIFKNITLNEEYDLPIKVTKRKVISEDFLKTINGTIGESTTSFSGADKNRITNLKISSKKINNVVIMPGETFSFSKYINNIVPSEGYKNASTFLNGEIVQGIGGGICQISSTLYQAALKSDLQIIERNQHSLRVGYCSLGLDAMFYEGSSDLKFKNNFKFPVVIQSSINGNNVNIKIIGDKTVKNYDVKIYTGNIEKIPMKTEIIYDDNLEYDKKEVIQKGHDGYKGKSYIKIGSEKEKVLNTDYYKPKKQIIKIGRKKNNSDQKQDDNIIVENQDNNVENNNND